jgi:hypothetical protein
MTPTRVRLWASVAGDMRHMLLGDAFRHRDGWKFYPSRDLPGRRPQRAYRKTWEACIPKPWSLDSTSSEVVQ